MTTSSQRISSHVLCAQAGELFMHCLNCCGRSNLDDRPSIENFPAKLNQYRINEFVDFIKANSLSNQTADKPKDNFAFQKLLDNLERKTKKWPITYNESFISNVFQAKQILYYIPENNLSDAQFTECIKCLECLKHENYILKNESHIVPIKSNNDQDLKVTFWVELEGFVKLYQDLSERHKILYSHTKMIKEQLIKNQNLENSKQQQNVKKIELDSYKKVKSSDYAENSEYENEKLSKRRKFAKDLNPVVENSLLNFWTNVLDDKNKVRIEFYGRVSNLNSDLAPLYQNLKVEENQPNKQIGSKLEMA